MTGLPAPALFSLDMSKIYEVWRPLTAVAYLGAPSMSMANSLYFLLQYGQTLEKNNGICCLPAFIMNDRYTSRNKFLIVVVHVTRFVGIFIMIIVTVLFNFTSGTAEHSWFLILQTAMLTALGFLLGFPFQSQAMIAAIVYVCSRVSPMEKMYVGVYMLFYFVHTYFIVLRVPAEMGRGGGV